MSNPTAPSDSPFKLTVSSASVPDAVLDALEPEELAAGLSPLGRRMLQEEWNTSSCTFAEEYTVYVFTREDEAAAQALARALDGLQQVQQEGGSDGLLSLLGGAAVCAAALGDGGALFLPSIDKPEGVSFYQKRHILKDEGSEAEQPRARRRWRRRRRQR